MSRAFFFIPLLFSIVTVVTTIVGGADSGPIPQSEWTSGTPSPRPERMTKHRNGITSIVIHHTQTPNEAPAMERARLRSVQRYHIEDREWGDVAYHYFIGASGNIYEGRDWHLQGDSGTKYDLDGRLLICLLGDFSDVLPTEQAMAVLPAFVSAKLKEHGLTTDELFTHQMVAATDCPGATLQKWFEENGKASISGFPGKKMVPGKIAEPASLDSEDLPLPIPPGFSKIPSLAILPDGTTAENTLVDLRIESPDKTCQIAVTAVQPGTRPLSEASGVITWKPVTDGETVTSVTSNREREGIETLIENIGVSGKNSSYVRYFQRSYPVDATSNKPAVLWELMASDSAARDRWHSTYKDCKKSLKLGLP